jgi:hypothetical protein
MKKEVIEEAALICTRAATCLSVGDDCLESGAIDRDYGCYECNEEASKQKAGEVVDASFDAQEVATDDVFVCGETSPHFTRLLPVALSEEDLAERGAEMARLIGIWTKAKLDKKAFDKSIKSLIDTTEEQYIEIAVIVDAAAEEKEVDCYWQFDSAHCLKRLYRCDTGDLVEESVMTAADLQRDFNWQAEESEKNVNAMAQEAEQEAETSGSGSQAEEVNTITAENLFDGPGGDSVDISAAEDAL